MFFSIIKIVHIISAISWMAGLFYLPRLFVYHASEKPTSATSSTFKIMEHKLYSYIMIPAMILTWVTGLIMASMIGAFENPIFFIKGFSVFLLTGYHYYLASCLAHFKNNTNKKSHKFYRIINEIPTILLIIIISVVVLK